MTLSFSVLTLIRFYSIIKGTRGVLDEEAYLYLTYIDYVTPDGILCNR